MGAMFKFYKRRFRNALEPVFVMLISKKSKLNEEEWNDVVEHVTVRVLNNPTEFLGTELPEYNTLCDVLYEIFEQFAKEKGYGKSSFNRIASQLEMYRNHRRSTAA